MRRVEETAGVCDLCGSHDAERVLESSRLDGPLVRCRRCGLFFVVRSQNADAPSQASDVVGADISRLIDRAAALGLVDPHAEEGERPWRMRTARERVNDVRRLVSSGRLLEVGSATGDFLAEASPYFDAVGLEPDYVNCQMARRRALDCRPSTLVDARLPSAHFDAAVSYHVIEHVPSPRAELRELQRIVRPGGWLVMETPNIDSAWFRVLGARWRQMIPDHIFFFSPDTIRRLCAESGFDVVTVRQVDRGMSVRLLLTRLSRYHRGGARLLRSACDRLKLSDRTINVRLSDVMRVYARRAG